MARKRIKGNSKRRRALPDIVAQQRGNSKGANIYGDVWSRTRFVVGPANGSANYMRNRDVNIGYRKYKRDAQHVANLKEMINF